MKTRRATSLALVPFMLGVILLAGCKGGTSPEALSPDSSNTANQFPELHDALAAEFARLGIDPDKVPAKVASGDSNAVFDLALTVDDPDGEGPTPASGVTLKWTERMLGDYDQNGLVNASDITPLGQNFQQAVTYDDPFSHNGLEYWPAGDPDDGGSGAANWRRARVDGNDDGLVGLSDITTIAQHWNEQLSGYVVQMAVNRGDGELNWTDVDSGNGIAPSIARPSVNNAAAVRYELYIPLGEAQFAHHFRVLPYDAVTDERGELSNRADYYPVSQGDTTPPYWLDTVGVQKLVPSSEQIKVEFGNAEDSQSPPVSYRIYWEESSEGSLDPFDYVSAQSADVMDSPYTITGLTNELYYRVAVRALDSAETQNEEKNQVLLGAMVEPRDVYPPEWTARVGLQEVLYGNGLAVMIWDPAVDSHTDEHGTWESGPVIYRVYYGEGLTPDFNKATTLDFPDKGLDYYIVTIPDLDTSIHRWFSVRALDQATIPNEDDNDAVIVRRGSVVTNHEKPGPGPGIPPTAQKDASSKAAEPDGFVQNASRTETYYYDCYVDPPGEDMVPRENWISLWKIEGNSITHSRDLMIGEYTGELVVQALCVDNVGKLKVFSTLNPSLSGMTTVEFREGEGEIFNKEMPKCSITHAGCTYDPSDICWSGIAKWENDDVLNPRFTYYLDIPPLNLLSSYWDTDDHDGFISNPSLDSAFLSDSSIFTLIRPTDPNDGNYLYSLEVTSSEVVVKPFNMFPETSGVSVTGWDSINPLFVEYHKNGNEHVTSMYQGEWEGHYEEVRPLSEQGRLYYTVRSQFEVIMSASGSALQFYDFANPVKFIRRTYLVLEDTSYAIPSGLDLGLNFNLGINIRTDSSEYCGFSNTIGGDLISTVQLQ